MFPVEILIFEEFYTVLFRKRSGSYSNERFSEQRAQRKRSLIVTDIGSLPNACLHFAVNSKFMIRTSDYTETATNTKQSNTTFASRNSPRRHRTSLLYDSNEPNKRSNAFGRRNGYFRSARTRLFRNPVRVFLYRRIRQFIWNMRTTSVSTLKGVLQKNCYTENAAGNYQGDALRIS